MGCPSEVVIEKNITFAICTHDPDTGALTDAGAVPVYWIYEDETGTSINASTPSSDVMAKLDDANTTGFYAETVACTAANGFEVHKTYTIYIEATVGGDTGGITYGFRVATAVWDEVLNAANYNIPSSAGRRLRNLQDFGVYALASVWVDETGGQSTGTTVFEDATVNNRADDFDNAQTVAAAATVNIDRIHVQNDNTITLAATLNGYDVWGIDWTLALGGQDVGSTAFTGATVSGIGTGTTPHFHECTIGTATLPPSHVHGSSLTATITCGSAGGYQFIDCQSGVAGSGAPTVDLGSGVGATTMEFRRWSGGLTLTNIEAGDVISVDALTGGTLTLTMSGGTVEARGSGMKALVVNGSGGTVNVAGHYGAITDNSGGAVTITQTWALNRAIVNIECDTAFADYSPATAIALTSVASNVTLILDDTGTSGVVVAAASKTGYSLVDTGLDLVLIDGQTLPAALQIVAAVVAGVVSGAGDGEEIFVGLDGLTTRATVTVDGSGNRTGVVYA